MVEHEAALGVAPVGNGEHLAVLAHLLGKDHLVARFQPDALYPGGYPAHLRHGVPGKADAHALAGDQQDAVLPGGLHPQQPVPLLEGDGRHPAGAGIVLAALGAFYIALGGVEIQLALAFSLLQTSHHLFVLFKGDKGV